MEELTVAAVLTLAGAGLVVSPLVEVVIRALAWDEPTQGRFGPLLALALGIVVVVAAAAASGGNLPQAVLTGAMAGFMAMGIHGLVTSATRQPTSFP